MPEKKDPEYFPLNMNVNLFDFEPSFHHGKYENCEGQDEDGISTDDEMVGVADVLRSRSGSNTSHTRRIRNVSLNMTQNSDDEGEGSLQSSSDFEIEDGEEEVDMMDTLVLSIREKLGIWTGESTPPSTPFDSQSSSCQSSHSHLRRRRLCPYSSKSRNPLFSIQKKGTTTKQHYWASGRRGKRDAVESVRDRPYELLQELLQSGGLIKEAVRRLSVTKRIVNGRSSPQSPAANVVGPLLSFSPPTNTARFPSSTRGEEEISFPE